MSNLMDFIETPAVESGPAEEQASRSSNPLGVSALLLGVLAPLTLGLTAIPGLCCAALSLRREQGRCAAIIGMTLSVVTLAAGGVAYQRLFHAGADSVATGLSSQAGVARVLEVLKLPSLPASAREPKVYDLSVGQSVTYWVRFSASEADCEQFVAKLNPMIQRDRIPHALSAMSGLPDWFDASDVQQGWYLVVEGPPLVRIGYDLQRQVIYVMATVFGRPSD